MQTGGARFTGILASDPAVLMCAGALSRRMVVFTFFPVRFDAMGS